MNNVNSLKLFNDNIVRTIWKSLKTRFKKEGNKLVTNCNQLKMKSTDGKYYNTDVLDTEQLLRIIQFVPFKKASF